MKDMLDCARAEELLSDHLEGVLEDPLRADVGRHLASCQRCRELFAALREVVGALRSAPELDPALDLAERAAAAALRAAEAPRLGAVRRLALPRLAAAGRQVFASSVPGLVRGLAAALALAITGGVLLAQSVMGQPVRAANRVVERTVTAGAYLAERKDRLVEDFRLLRVVIGTAFEGRLDRVNDRMDDYRRLLERRRALQATPERPPDAEGGPPAVDEGGAPGADDHRDASRSDAPRLQFVNFQVAAAVPPCVTRQATRRIGRPGTRSCARRIA